MVILLAMLMAFFAVVGYYIFGYEEETGDKENWGTLSTAMLTLFTFVTVSCVHVFFVLLCFVLFCFVFFHFKLLYLKMK